MILATRHFVREYKKLAKIKKTYGNVGKDIATLLNASTIDDLLKFGDVVTYLEDADQVKPYKIRVGNSTMKEGKSSGYRLIVAVDDEHLILCSVYAKKGELSKVKPSTDDWESIIDSYLSGEAYEVNLVGNKLEIVAIEEQDQN